MALYTYQCPEHGEFEAEHPITAPKGATCPTCGKKTETRLITGTSFVLNGGGWYRDGYSSNRD